MQPTISVIIPVYNGAQTIGDLVEQLSQVLPELSRAFEIILIEDDGKDNSWQVIESLVNQYEHLTAFRMMRNYGQHAALLCGIREAQYDVIVTMDDDLQHPPTEIPKLLNLLSEGYDVVYGKPENEQHGIWRDLASQMTKLVLQNAMGADTAQSISAFRVFRTELRDAFIHFNSPTVNLDVLLTWATTRFTFVRVRHEPRQHGVSNYTFWKLVNHSLNMLTGFSTVPLRIASMLGLVMTVFGLIVLVYVIGRYVLQGSPVQGFPFLASTIAIFSGAQLFAIGIIGEYLARIHLRSMDRPTYTVRTKLHSPQALDEHTSTDHESTL